MNEVKQVNATMKEILFLRLGWRMTTRRKKMVRVPVLYNVKCRVNNGKITDWVLRFGFKIN